MFRKIHSGSLLEDRFTFVHNSYRLYIILREVASQKKPLGFSVHQAFIDGILQSLQDVKYVV